MQLAYVSAACVHPACACKRIAHSACACKRVPKQNERSWENVSVLVPHIAALFKLLIAKATIPRSWKEAKLTPIHKKGPVTQPGNYRMIAISNTV